MKNVVEIPIRVLDVEGDGYHLMVKGAINGKTALFIIDTGASRSVFDPNIITSFIDDPQFEKKGGVTAGVGGSDLESATFRIDSLRIGDLEIRDYEGVALSLQAIHESYAKIDLPVIHGIIGGDLLMRHNAVINYRMRKIKLKKPSPNP